jgi:hypothetical protein
MQLLEFGQRFLNYKAIVRLINNHNGKVLFQGMFMDAPYRFLKFMDLVRVETDLETAVLVIYASANGPMFFHTESHLPPYINGEVVSND